MRRRRAAWLTAFVVLAAGAAGCTTSAGPTEIQESTARNATLGLSGYGATATASPVETRRVYDRSAAWEGGGERNLTVVSHAGVYRAADERAGENASATERNGSAAGRSASTAETPSGAGSDGTPAGTVVVYTTPAEPYVGADNPRGLSAVDLAALATRSVDVAPPGTASEGEYAASLLNRSATVDRVVDAEGETAGHVARVVDDETFVVVVVVGDVDEASVERILAGVTIEPTSRDGTGFQSAEGPATRPTDPD